MVFWPSGKTRPQPFHIRATLCATVLATLSTVIPMAQHASLSRKDIVLAALAGGGLEACFNPVQIQNLLFLIDRESVSDLGAPRFAFEPGPYGPYDHGVSELLGELAAEGLVLVDQTGPYWTYRVSEAGWKLGKAGLERLAQPAVDELHDVADWILAQPVWDLMLTIAALHPEMALDRWLLRLAHEGARPEASRRIHPFLAGMAKVIAGWGWRGERASARRYVDSDATAIASDWRAVGDDLRFAMESAKPIGTP